MSMGTGTITAKGSGKKKAVETLKSDAKRQRRMLTTLGETLYHFKNEKLLS